MSAPRPLDGLIIDSQEQFIIANMITHDDISAVKAVEEIVSLTTLAAGRAATQEQPAREKNDLYLHLHARFIIISIIQHAVRIPHDQQSKFVDFCIRLQQTIVPDPNDGGVLELNETESFWSVIPKFQMATMSTWYREEKVEEDVLEDGKFEPGFLNMTAFLAQLIEREFYDTPKGTWKSFNLRSFVAGHCRRPRPDIRYFCMWLIYAPRTIWFYARSESEEDHGHRHLLDLRLPVENFWPEWKERLLDYHRNPGILVDRETYELIEMALFNMNEIEAENLT